MLDLRIFPRSRVQLVRQSEISECGLACLAMVASYHGLNIDLVTIRRRFPQSLQGTSLRNLIDIATAFNMVPRAVKVSLASLPSLGLPAILHWNLNHYVVLERVERTRVLIHDPDVGSIWYALDDASLYFTGVALELRPANDFFPGNLTKKLKLSDLWEGLKGFAGAGSQIILLSLFIEAFLLASPYFTQIAIDSVLPAMDSDLLVVLAMSFGCFVLFSAVALALRGLITTSLGAQLGFGISANIGRRLFRLPLSWFEKRKIGDVLSRFLSVVPIQKTLTEGALVGIVDGSLVVVTLLMMLVYSVKLALVTIICCGLYLLVRSIIVLKLRKAQQVALAARAKEQSFLIESIQGVLSTRLSGKDSYRHSLWQSNLADAVNADIRISRLTIWNSTANFAIFGIENIIVIAVGISQIIYDQQLTIGMLMAFVAYKSHFISKAGSFLDQLLAVNIMSLHLDRLSDITQAEEDPLFHEDCAAVSAKEIGIDMRAVSFTYVPELPPIVRNINLTIKPGEHIALSGASGSGKSTIVKLLLGTLKPSAGEILVNGVPVSRFGYRNLHLATAAVTQGDRLFAGSIRDNITLFDQHAHIDHIAAAAMAASIHNEIILFPMQYDTLVGDMGSALSSGQQQRVLIARALYKKPKLLIMDEGTANIDEANEARIFQWLKLTGATILSISHKPTTILRADRIVYIAGGEVSLTAPLQIAVDADEDVG